MSWMSKIMRNQRIGSEVSPVKVKNHTNTKCWPGHAPKPGEPKTKISSKTGERVNNCSS